jgi:hypothetical protein
MNETNLQATVETLETAGKDVAGSLETLLNNGWEYHDKESERLASELELAAKQEVTSSDLSPFLHLSAHTIGEHLRDWPRVFALGKRVLDRRTPTPSA